MMASFIKIIPYILIFMVLAIIILVIFICLEFFKKKSPESSIQPEKEGKKNFNKPQSFGSILSQKEIGDLKVQVTELEERIDILEERHLNLFRKMQAFSQEQGISKDNPHGRSTVNLGNNNIEKSGIQPDRCDDSYHETKVNRNRKGGYFNINGKNNDFRNEIKGEMYGRDSICESLYNQSINNPEVRREFMENYRPVRIGVKNSMDRMKDPTIPPDFQDADQGDYLAVCIKRESQIYEVFPIFGVPLQDSNYSAGAMEKVFECDDYDGRYRFKIVKILMAATFEKKYGNKWIIQKKGKLKLEKRDD